MKKKSFFIVALILGSLFIFQRKNLSQNSTKQNVLSTQDLIENDTSILNTKPKNDFTKNENADESLFPESSQNEIKTCIWKNTGPYIKDLHREIFLLAGNPQKEDLEEKSIIYENNEQKYRLSIEASESGNTSFEMKIFSLDQDDMPDLVKIPDEHKINPSEKIIQSYLSGKRIIKTTETKIYLFPQGQILKEKLQDSNPVYIEFMSDAGKLLCSTQFKASCKCISAKN